MIIRLKNISFKTFLFGLTESEQEEYNFACKFGDIITGKDIFAIGSFHERSFGCVKDIQTLYGNVNIDAESFYNEFVNILDTHFDVSEDRLLDISVFDYFDTISFFAKEIRLINTIEESLISTVGEPIDEGSSVFAKFGVLAQYLNLAGNDITKINKIEKLDYSLCFSVLLYRKEQYEYQYQQSKKKR